MEVTSEGGNPFYPLTSRAISEGGRDHLGSGEKHHQTLESQVSALQLTSKVWLGSQKDLRLSREAQLRRIKSARKSWIEATEISFAPFLRLPVELRSLIWEFSCNMHGRIVLCRGRYVDLPRYKNHLRPNAGVIGACKESRAEALKHYRSLHEFSPVYYNPGGSDIFYEQYEVFRTPFNPLITRFAIGFYGLPGYEDIKFDDPATITRITAVRHRHFLQSFGLKSLQELLLVVNIPLRPQQALDLKDSDTLVIDGPKAPKRGFPYTFRSVYTHVVEDYCRCFMQTDLSEAEKQAGVPRVRFVEEQFTPGLATFRYENFDEYSAGMPFPSLD